MVKHIATLPLGAIEQFGSGKLRRTISETAGSAETYLAHQLPGSGESHGDHRGASDAAAGV